MQLLMTNLNGNTNSIPIIKINNNGLIPVCAWCKKTRDLNQQWHHLDLAGHEKQLTHTICPNCREGLTDDFQPQKNNFRNQLTLTVSWQVLDPSTVVTRMQMSE